MVNLVQVLLPHPLPLESHLVAGWALGSCAGGDSEFKVSRAPAGRGGRGQGVGRGGSARAAWVREARDPDRVPRSVRLVHRGGRAELVLRPEGGGVPQEPRTAGALVVARAAGAVGRGQRTGRACHHQIHDPWATGRPRLQGLWAGRPGLAERSSAVRKVRKESEGPLR